MLNWFIISIEWQLIIRLDLNIKPFLIKGNQYLLYPNLHKNQIQILNMLQIKGTNKNNLECYLLTIRQKHFLSISQPDLSLLKHFNQSFSLPQTIIGKPKHKQQEQSSDSPQIKSENRDNKKIEQQRNYEDTKIKCQPQQQEVDFSRLRIHLDLNFTKQLLNFINSHPKTVTLNIIITDYRQFLVLPYLVKKFHGKKEMKIFSTHIGYEMGKIYLKQFFSRITQFDLLQSQPKDLTYDQQSRLEDQFYLRFGVDIKTWSKIFTQEDMLLALSLVHRMNYDEVFDADGVSLKPIPSGHSLGSSCWMFENLLTKQTTLFVRQISTQKWRCIKKHPFMVNDSDKQKQPFKQKTFTNVDLLILANPSLITPHKDKPETDIQHLLHKVGQNLQKGLNTQIVLEDELLILDIIDFISFEFKDKFKGIFISNPQFSQIVSYANSYVEFLSPSYKERIYQDPPQYPFDSYMILKQKGFIFTGSLHQISEKEKVPLKQLLRRSTPYIHFRSTVDAYLDNVEPQKDNSDPLNTILWYQQRDYFSSSQLTSLLSQINAKKTISFTNLLPYLQPAHHPNTAILPYGKNFSITSTPYHHYVSKNISPNIINKYEFVDGFIMAYPVNRQFLRLNSNWKQQLQKHLNDIYRPVIESKENYIKTKSSLIQIENYQITIKSSDPHEMLKILQIISAITKTLRLK